MATSMTGGCQCGHIRYEAEIDSDEAYLCHCRMCRRATGGVSIAFVNVRRDALRWERKPDWYRSSPIAQRPFCARCGTPLGFAFLDGEGDVDITLGSFDDPTRFRPTHHSAAESILPAWLDTNHLPRIRSDENENVTKRWLAATAAVPD